MVAGVTSRSVRPSTRRGSDSVHDDETLLDLIAAVARWVAASDSAPVTAAERVSMPAFNRARAVVDRERGIVEANDRERTPTAEAIHLRFNKHATRRVKWAEIVAASLREERTMWLAALPRALHEPVAVEVVAYALQRVALKRDTKVLSMEQYRQTRELLIAEDNQRWGENGLLEQALPTVNQIDGQYGFGEALTLVGLRGVDPKQKPPPQHPPPPQPAGLPVADAMALYAAVNGCWASRTTLRAFARASGFSLEDTKGIDWDIVLADARVLLTNEGESAPEAGRAKPQGRGKRLTVTFPVNGVPGARPYAPRHAQTGRPRQRFSRVPLDREAVRRELCIIALRVWLRGLRSREKRTQTAYLAWRRGTKWPPPSAFTRFGGFTALKDEAAAVNRRYAQAGVGHGHEVRARGEAILADLEARKRPGKPSGDGAVPRPEPPAVYAGGV